MFRMHLLAAVLVICAPAHAAGTAVFRETTYDFGTVKQGQKVTHVFPVRNTGDTPVTIERVELQMPGVTARFRPLIAPGDEGKITLVGHFACYRCRGGRSDGAVRCGLSVTRYPVGEGSC